MSNGNFVNLNEVGVLGHSGQQYGVNADDQSTESRSFQGRMEASHAGLKGSSGMTFQGVSQLSGANLAQLATHIAEQARRAVQTENTLVGSDEEGHAAQQTAVGAGDSLGSSLSRGINV